MQLGTRCAHPPPPFSGSLTHSVSLCFLTVACKPKNVLTSEGRLLKCLLNVFSLCCLFLFRSLSLLHSCSLMCKQVSEPTLRSLLYCLITQIVFANSARQVDGSMLLSQAVYWMLLIWHPRRTMFCIQLCGVSHIFAPQLDPLSRGLVYVRRI